MTTPEAGKFYYTTTNNWPATSVDGHIFLRANEPYFVTNVRTFQVDGRNTKSLVLTLLIGEKCYELLLSYGDMVVDEWKLYEGE